MTRLTHRILAAAAIIALPASVLWSSPSQAASATTQNASCVDGGGVRWNSRTVWGGTYVGGDGVERVSVYDVGWSTAGGRVKTDSRIRTYDGTGVLSQQLDWSGSFEYRHGAASKLRNPGNPAAKTKPAQVKVTLGVDGDGHGDCTVTFTQPGVRATPSLSPTASASQPESPTPTPTPSPTPSPSSTPTLGTAGDQYEADVVAGTNTVRGAAALTLLAPQACVDSFAEAQAGRMVAQNRMFHQDLGPILSTCHLHMVGENVAYGFPSGQAVMVGWMNSPGHRANILTPGYRLIGVGAAQDSQGRWYAAQVFGA